MCGARGLIHATSSIVVAGNVRVLVRERLALQLGMRMGMLLPSDEMVYQMGHQLFTFARTGYGLTPGSGLVMDTDDAAFTH